MPLAHQEEAGDIAADQLSIERKSIDGKADHETDGEGDPEARQDARSAAHGVDLQ